MAQPALTLQAYGRNALDTGSRHYNLPQAFTMPVRLQSKVQQPVPLDFYTRNFGFFCKQELNMHKAGVPLSFRLGSMEYCNMLEQKGH